MSRGVEVSLLKTLVIEEPRISEGHSLHLRTLKLIVNFKIFPNCSLQDAPFSDLFICLNQETLHFVACNLELYYDERTYKYQI
jgi:hypothetical protein